MYIISLAESQLTREWIMEIKREMRLSQWLERPRPVPFKQLMIDTLPLISDYRATGIVSPLRYRPISFDFGSPSPSSRGANVNRGESFVTRYEPLLRSKLDGD